jgi:hypothetical protein
MERELIGLDALFLAALLDQSLGQFRAFAISDHPAGDVTAEDIEDHVEIKVGPFNWAENDCEDCVFADLSTFIDSIFTMTSELSPWPETFEQSGKS